MVYMGSKAKYSKYIIPILQQIIDNNNIQDYIECFVGGANIIDKIRCENRTGFDRSNTLIALLNQAKTDFSKIPLDGNREMWDKGKAYVKDSIMPKDMTLYEIGAIEFFASFNNGGFPRGYAKNSISRNYYQIAYRNMEKQAKNLKDITFYCQNYWELEPVNNCLIYLDPPYKGTKHYGYANQEKMDYDKFWNWVRQISQNNIVIISEQTAPEDFKIIWEMEVKRTANKENNFKATEKLFQLSY